MKQCGHCQSGANVLSYIVLGNEAMWTLPVRCICPQLYSSSQWSNVDNATDKCTYLQQSSSCNEAMWTMLKTGVHVFGNLVLAKERCGKHRQVHMLLVIQCSIQTPSTQRCSQVHRCLMPTLITSRCSRFSQRDLGSKDSVTSSSLIWSGDLNSDLSYSIISSSSASASTPVHQYQ